MNQVTPQHTRIAVLGGVYSNHVALDRAIRDARNRGAEALYCLGDLGAFGPSPDKVFPLLQDSDAHIMRGNYDDSIGRGLTHCQCGYTDPRDNHFATLSYRYTFDNTSPANRQWLAKLPTEFRFQLGDLRVLCCHGSPRQINEFLWESATPTHFLARLARDYDFDLLLGTHTGIHWSRQFGPSGWYVNVGSIGRPPNNGQTNVWYTMLEARGKELNVDFVPLEYDYEILAAEMVQEELPIEFIDTIRTGWWTTCLEILPARERAQGRY